MKTGFSIKCNECGAQVSLRDDPDTGVVPGEKLARSRIGIQKSLYEIIYLECKKCGNELTVELHK